MYRLTLINLPGKLEDAVAVRVCDMVYLWHSGVSLPGLLPELPGYGRYTSQQRLRR